MRRGRLLLCYDVKRLFFFTFLSIIIGFNSYGQNNSGKSGKLPEIFHKWSYGEGEGERQRGMEILSCFSDNYNVVDGRKIALIYGADYWAESPVVETVFGVGFAFVDVSDILDENNSNYDKSRTRVPQFAKYTKGKKLSVNWLNNNTSSNIKIGNILRNTILIYYPNAMEFQKQVNRNKKFRVTVEISSGKKLNYYFDFSDLEPLPVF